MLSLLGVCTRSDKLLLQSAFLQEGFTWSAKDSSEAMSITSVHDRRVAMQRHTG